MFLFSLGNTTSIKRKIFDMCECIFDLSFFWFSCLSYCLFVKDNLFLCKINFPFFIYMPNGNNWRNWSFTFMLICISFKKMFLFLFYFSIGIFLVHYKATKNERFRGKTRHYFQKYQYAAAITSVTFVQQQMLNNRFKGENFWINIRIVRHNHITSNM